MRALHFLAPRRVAVREEPLGPPAAGQVLVKTLVSAISPGTEMLVYRGQVPAGMPLDSTLPVLAGGFTYPLKYGYAVVGQVGELGEGADPEWLDRLVLSFHPHASHFLAAPQDLLAVPAGVSAEEAAFLPNLETAVNFLMDGQPIVGEQVVVFGQGVVGLLTTALLARLPLSRLVTVDRLPLRRQKSLDLGAHAALDPEAPAALAGLRASADLTYELSGSPSALEQAIAATGFAGRVVIGSWYGDQRASLSLGGDFHRSRIQLVSSQVSTIAPRWSARWSKSRRLEVAWRLLAELKPAGLITHRFPFADAPEAYDLLDRRPGEAIQVLLSYEC
jgi:2-desacetyl-2-hydroxyethyl bacteriochlorophyllide A dehydrogenase